MIDWPSASVVLGVLGTIATAIVKYAPKGSGNGHIFAKREDVATVIAKLDGIDRRLSIIEQSLR